MDLPADLQLVVRRGAGPRPSDRRAHRRVRVGRERDRQRRQPRRPSVGRARRRRAPRRRRLVPARVSRRSDRQLVPGARHRAGERGSHRRRPERPRQSSGLPSPTEAVEAADHCVRRPPPRRPRPARLARVDQDDAAQLDRAQRRRDGRRSPSKSTKASRSPCSRPAPTRCSAPPTWCSRRSILCSTRSCRASGPTPPSCPTSATCRTPGRASSGPTSCRRKRCVATASSQSRSPTSSGSPKVARRPECSPARSRRTPPTVGTSRSSSPTTCSWVTAPERSWRCRPTTSATSSSREEFDLPIVAVVRPPDGWLRERDVDADTPADQWPEAYVGEGVGMNSSNDDVSLDGLPTPEAKRAIAAWLEASETGEPSVTYKLRDWLFSRQRYWGEPFPIVYDDDGNALALPESLLPVELPEITDFEPRILADDDPSPPEPPLARADDWVDVELDLGDGLRHYRRETNTMPQWAGSCWYYLRYLDPTNDHALDRPRGRAVLDGHRRLGRRRPLRGRRRARGAAPPLRALLAQGALRPRSRLHARAVPPLVQPGHDDRVRIPRRPWHVRRRVRRSRSATARSLYDGQPVSAALGPHGQEPKEHGHARRDLPRLRRRHAAPLRDVHGPARREPCRGAPPTSWACTDSSSASGATSSTKTPASCASRPDPADDETRRLLHRTIDAVRADMGTLEYNTAIAAALRAQQPSHAGGCRKRQRAAKKWCTRWR